MGVNIDVELFDNISDNKFRLNLSSPLWTISFAARRDSLSFLALINFAVSFLLSAFL